VKYKLIYYNVPPQEIAKNTAKSLIQLKPPLQKWLELSNSGVQAISGLSGALKQLLGECLSQKGDVTVTNPI